MHLSALLLLLGKDTSQSNTDAGKHPIDPHIILPLQHSYIDHCKYNYRAECSNHPSHQALVQFKFVLRLIYLIAYLALLSLQRMHVILHNHRILFIIIQTLHHIADILSIALHLKILFLRYLVGRLLKICSLRA